MVNATRQHANTIFRSIMELFLSTSRCKVEKPHSRYPAACPQAASAVRSAPAWPKKTETNGYTGLEGHAAPLRRPPKAAVGRGNPRGILEGRSRLARELELNRAENPMELSDNTSHQAESTRKMTRADSRGLLRSIARPSTRVGCWELVELAAGGTWARVYRARPAASDPGRPAQYAVKILQQCGEEDSGALERLRREAAVGRGITSPHVVPVLSSSVYHPPYYVVMPWLSGTTLRAQFPAGQICPVHAALAIARQVASGLDALERAGWIHGDLKPSNIFVSPEGHVTLIDLGFAQRPPDVGSVVQRSVQGTCSYFAPEAIISTLRADVRSDIYSLGVVFYELLCGSRPFEAVGLADLVTAQLRQSAPRLEQRAPHVPPPVARLAHQMLAKDPLRRPQTATEVVQAIVPLEIDALAALHG